MANQVRIEYDPYQQKASYQIRISSNQKFTEIPKSDLGNPDNLKYHDGMLDEILKYAIPELQEKRLAKELVFCGTEDDFQDFKDALAQFYERKPDTMWNMTLLRDETSYYRAADTVKSEINAIFQGIVDTLTEKQNEDVYRDVCRKLESYTDAVSNEIPVCVIGVYSAGKSAFLNAIIGRELLPSHETETTAKITKIVRADTTCIRFTYSGTEIKLPMDTGCLAEKTAHTPELDMLLEQLNRIDGNLPEDQRVYQILEVVNALPFETVPMITLETPFRKSSLPDDIRFVFYDTPGAKTADNPKHEEILKEELLKRSNGLPVFVANMNSIGMPDVIDTAISIVEKAGASLDKRNTLLIINKADGVSPDSLEKISNTWRTSEISKLPKLLKWQHRHVLFTASVVALGYKLKPAGLQSGEYRLSFSRTESAFRNPGEFYCSLPQYGLLPKAQADAALAAVQAAEKNPDELALQNSGLPAVEAAITRFARRYASYHKCRKATEYLTDAIQLTNDELKKQQAEMEDTRNQIHDAYQSRYGSLLKEIDACFNAFSLEEIGQPITNDFNRMKADENLNFTSRAKEIVLTCCRNSRKEKYKTGLDCQIQVGTERLSKGYTEKCTKELENLYGIEYEKLRAALLQAIDADAATTMDEKQSLQTVVKQMPLTPPSVQFSIRKLGLIKGHKFLMWDWETASEKKCVEAVIDWSSITRLEAAEEAQRSYGGTYEQCCAALKTRLENPRNLEKWNPELAALAQQLDKVQRTIDQLRAKQRDLNQKKAEVEALMRKQEV